MKRDEKGSGWWLAAGAGGLLVLLGALRFLPAWGEPEERKIWGVIEAIRKAVEEKSPAGVVEHLDPAYRDADGLERQELRRMLLARFRGSAASFSVVVVPGDLEIAEDGREASAELWAAGFEGLRPSELSEATGGEAYAVRTRLRKGQDGLWRVVWHEREPLSVADVWERLAGEP
jgi:hypothetical protein